MTRQDADRDDNVCGPCRIGEHGHCDGNHNLTVGAGPAVPLTRCACWRCRRRIREGGQA